MTQVFSLVAVLTVLLLAGQSAPSFGPDEQLNGPRLNGAPGQNMTAFAVEGVELAGGVFLSR